MVESRAGNDCWGVSYTVIFSPIYHPPFIPPLKSIAGGNVEIACVCDGAAMAVIPD